MPQPPEQFKNDANIVIKSLMDFYVNSNEGNIPAINQQPIANILEELKVASFLKDGNLKDGHLQEFMESYLSFCTSLRHPGFLAHQVGVTDLTGALGSLIEGFTNNGIAVYEMGPPGASIEYAVINWMLSKVGWNAMPTQPYSVTDGSAGGGILVHGGSIANLTALIAARSAAVTNFWQDGTPDNLVFLSPEKCHYSVKRAIGIMGLGNRSHVPLPVDENGRTDPGELAAVIRRLKEDGKIIGAVVASAADTAVGLYDDLDQIGDICNEEKVWLHVDGAHGASALLSDKYRYLMKGIEKADSVIWDAHKLMRTPMVCAALLVKDLKHLDNAFEQDAHYLVHDKTQPGFDSLHRTIECTKPPLGLKIFMSIAAKGEQDLGRYITNITDRAKDIARYISDQPGFEVAVEPETNILCFRVDGSDEKQTEVRDKILDQGDFYFSSTLFRGRRWLRLVVMNENTTVAYIAKLLNTIRGMTD